ncbi:MAG: hypothetical protein EXR53_03295 [Dehalococcoidia bacterium]|nr:hypothetical protein [Dehalococcoidia bacterium]
MHLWKLVLGIVITVAVLSLAYGVVNKRYQAVLNERDESIRLGQQLSVNIAELQQRLTSTEGILAGKVGDIRVLQATLDYKNLQLGKLEVSEAGLKAQLGTLQTERDSLVDGLRLLDLSHKELQLDYGTLQGEYTTLSSAVGTLEGVKSQVSGLQQQVQSLNGDMARLQAARAPLIVESYRVGFKCTGSMEPKITCLDEATWLSNFRPQEVKVGTVISFTPTAECKLSSASVAHRVTAINLEAGTIYYRPKGDANSSDDGCWIPSSSVNGYIITLYKNTKLENAHIRDRINALKWALDFALAGSEQSSQIYKQYVSLHCPGNVCPSQYYGTAVSLYEDVQQKYSQYTSAYDTYRAAIEAEKRRL